MAQMKEQIKTPEKELNKMETSNLLDAEFKTLVIRMLNELSENFNKEIVSIKKVCKPNKNQSEMKTIITKMKNTLEEININEMKQRIKSAIWKTR